MFHKSFAASAAIAAGGLAPEFAAAQETIIVTAERRAQDAFDAPASISVVDKTALQLIGADHIAEALARAPGVNLHRGSGAEHLTAIRSPGADRGRGRWVFSVP